MPKTLVLHAGTHKTASTYIQNRLWINRKQLRLRGVGLVKPKRQKTGQHKPFADSLKALEFKRVAAFLDQDAFLGQRNHGCESLVVSAEQLTQALIRPECLDGLLDILKPRNIRLKVVIFLRDQPEYINSLYIQEVRRFYHAKKFSRFVEECKSSRSHWFDYEAMFAGLLDDPRLDVEFMPYGFHYGDPFERLMESQEWVAPPGSEWLPGDSAKSNDQPGIKGVSLAANVCKELNRLGVNRKLIRKRSKYVQRYSAPRDWGRQRYFGFTTEEVGELRGFYRQSNDCFARRVWGGRSWSEVFTGLKDFEQNILQVSSISDNERMELEGLLVRVVEDVKNMNPDACPV